MLDDHLAAEQHVLVLVDGVERRGAAAAAEHVDQGRRMGLDVGDLGIGDEHGRRRPLEPDELALADLEHQICDRVRSSSAPAPAQPRAAVPQTPARREGQRATASAAPAAGRPTVMNRLPADADRLELVAAHHGQAGARLVLGPQGRAGVGVPGERAGRRAECAPSDPPARGCAGSGTSLPSSATRATFSAAAGVASSVAVRACWPAPPRRRVAVEPAAHGDHAEILAARSRSPAASPPGRRRRRWSGSGSGRPGRPGRSRPALPAASSTGTEIARMPGSSTAARKPRSPGLTTLADGDRLAGRERLAHDGADQLRPRRSRRARDRSRARRRRASPASAAQSGCTKEPTGKVGGRDEHRLALFGLPARPRPAAGVARARASCERRRWRCRPGAGRRAGADTTHGRDSSGSARRGADGGRASRRRGDGDAVGQADRAAARRRLHGCGAGRQAAGRAGGPSEQASPSARCGSRPASPAPGARTPPVQRGRQQQRGRRGSGPAQRLKCRDQLDVAAAEPAQPPDRDAQHENG